MIVKTSNSVVQQFMNGDITFREYLRIKQVWENKKAIDVITKTIKEI